MIGSMVIAQINRGMATAVNQSGTLRMQSYRIGVALADEGVPPLERRARVERLATEFEQRLRSHRLTDALPRAANDPVRLAYERVRWRWAHEMRRALRGFPTEGAGEGLGGTQGAAAYLARVDDFVDDIHGLVRVLEERAERRIETLRLMQGVALALTVGVVLLTLIVVRRRVVTPLHELLDGADHVRRGDFSVRTRFVGVDELGRLGAAMNLMTEGLSQIYNELEERVAEKTRDLARTNRSLDLLYRTSRTLEASPPDGPVLQRVLEQIRGELRLADVTLCLRDGQGSAGSDCIGTARPAKPAEGCPVADCSLCAGPVPGDDGLAAPTPDGPRRVLGFPVADGEQRFGSLRVTPYPGRTLADWQRPLLEALAAHLASALSRQCRAREGRRLVLHEERSILARELHDSLAQSLSYLKIQAARLDAVLREIPAGTAATEISADIRAGISSAYRQLRELLTTFRLKIDSRGLGDALAETVRELGHRGGIAIDLDDRLPDGLLSPNEEVHVLQIVREALSNVIRHAGAGYARLALALADGEVRVSVADDGVGFSADEGAPGHHGIGIMRERAASLGGDLEIASGGGEGTLLSLRFRPRGTAETPAVGVPPPVLSPRPARSVGVSR
jgi:two-component system nitrate/nitrite sensor histidine kinase NarX